MGYKDKISKRLIIIDLEKDFYNDKNEKNLILLSKVKNYDLPDEFKKIIVVNEFFEEKRMTTYKGAYEFITKYPIDGWQNCNQFNINIGENIYSFRQNNPPSRKVAKNFYKDIINAGFFEKYIEFLNELFMIKDKEYMETYINNDKIDNKKLLKRKMKRELIK